MVKYLLLIIISVAFTLALVAMSSLSATYYWLDLVTSFIPHLLMLSLGLSLILIFIKPKLATSIAVITFTTLLINIPITLSFNYYNDPSITVSQLNLNYYNADIEGVYSLLGNEGSDITALFEVNDTERARFIALRGDYFDYGSAEIEGFPDGIGVITKFPILQRITHSVFENSVRGVIVELHLAVEHEKLRVFALHPPSPRNQKLWHKRNMMLLYLTNLLNQHHDIKHTLVLGDFNTGPLSQHFTRVERFNTCYQLAGHYASWSPVKLPQPLYSIFALTIDHCLLSDSLLLDTLTTQYIPGSDHAMLKYNIVLPKQ
ncbi:MAG: endonuclease/exonuclease/phosphatase family protein [Pseudomonadota bacterium]|nr:endonuclease/exonuclease/phosphatase family protein [Pseudomonadota bacterium]